MTNIKITYYYQKLKDFLGLMVPTIHGLFI